VVEAKGGARRPPASSKRRACCLSASSAKRLTMLLRERARGEGGEERGERLAFACSRAAVLSLRVPKNQGRRLIGAIEPPRESVHGSPDRCGLCARDARSQKESEGGEKAPPSIFESARARSLESRRF
jgi:hypothetical protein